MPRLPAKFEHVEQLGCVGRVDLALEREADPEHCDDGDEDEGAADPLAEEEVACAGDQPSGEQNHRSRHRCRFASGARRCLYVARHFNPDDISCGVLRWDSVNY